MTKQTGIIKEMAAALLVTADRLDDTWIGGAIVHDSTSASANLKSCPGCSAAKPRSGFYADKSMKDGLRRLCKCCTKAQNKAWYLKNWQARRAQIAAYMHANADRMREYQASWYQENREKRLAQTRAYRQAHPDWWRDYLKRWEAANPDKVKAKQARYRKTHPEAARERCARAKARKRGVVVEPVSYRRILERDGAVCHICGWFIDPEDLTFDHIIPLARGGAHAESNIALAHKRCNDRKWAHLDVPSAAPPRLRRDDTDAD